MADRNPMDSIAEARSHSPSGGRSPRGMAFSA
jgi:hypothetical protein